MDLQTFFESTIGQIFTVGLIVISLLLIAVFSKGSDKKFNTKSLTFSAVIIGIAFILNNITLYRMPQGGSITPFSMLVLGLVGYFFGVKSGILAGFSFGLLDMLINPYVINPIQALLDYPLAFGMLGLCGLFASSENYLGLSKGYVLAVLGRFLCSVASGVIFFGEFAPEGFSPLLWALVYNGTFMGIECIMTLIILNLKPIKNAILKVKHIAVPENV